MVARRQKQLFGATTLRCYMTLCYLFYLSLRSQQTQWSSQKKMCGRYRKIASQVKNKAVYVWSHYFFATTAKKPPKSGQAFFVLQGNSPLQNLWLLIILVISGSLFFKPWRSVNTESPSPNWASEPELIPVFLTLKYKQGLWTQWENSSLNRGIIRAKNTLVPWRWNCLCSDQMQKHRRKGKLCPMPYFGPVHVWKKHGRSTTARQGLGRTWTWLFQTPLLNVQ